MHTCTSCKLSLPKTEFYKSSNSKTGLYSYCKLCHKANMRIRQDENKRRLVEHFGGKCLRCGYSKNYRVLQFHHTNPSNKKFRIAARLSAGFGILLEEASKCEMICANCHAEEHVFKGL